MCRVWPLASLGRGAWQRGYGTGSCLAGGQSHIETDCVGRGLYCLKAKQLLF
jgi:hypothetical protein